jgi:capsular polysaccharide biosynthesis protein
VNDGDRSSNRGDETLILPVSANGDLRKHRDGSGHVWGFEDFVPPPDERPATETVTGLTSVPYITAALKRAVWFLIGAAIFGLFGGTVAYKGFPPPYQGTTSLLMTNSPTEDPVAAMATDVTLAQSRSVAGLAVSMLNPVEQAPALMKACVVVSSTDRVMVITCSASSSTLALDRTSALASAFLKFRANQLQVQQQAVLNSLNTEITTAEQRVESISKQINQVTAELPSSARTAKLASLDNQRTAAETTFSTLQQTVTGNQANSEVTTAEEIKNSGVLDPAALIAHSRLKEMGIYVIGGLIAALAIGIGIVIVRALVSDRLRRRDDVAQALGAPVKVSVGAVRLSRWRPGRHGLAAARSREIQRIVAHLRTVVPRSSRGAAALAIAAIDNAAVTALPLVSLALARAQEGQRVVVADLSDDATAARLLGQRKPGIHQVGAGGGKLALVVPDRNAIAPTGPFDRGLALAGPEPDPALVTACASADLILTLVTPDPSFGVDYLPTWAERVVVVVTAGRSSTTRIQAAGEILRLAEMHISSAVLVGADKTDESVGTVSAPDPAATADRDLGFLSQ